MNLSLDRVTILISVFAQLIIIWQVYQNSLASGRATFYGPYYERRFDTIKEVTKGCAELEITLYTTLKDSLNSRDKVLPFLVKLQEMQFILEDSTVIAIADSLDKTLYEYVRKEEYRKSPKHFKTLATLNRMLMYQLKILIKDDKSEIDSLNNRIFPFGI